MQMCAAPLKPLLFSGAGQQGEQETSSARILTTAWRFNGAQTSHSLPDTQAPWHRCEHTHSLVPLVPRPPGLDKGGRVGSMAHAHPVRLHKRVGVARVGCACKRTHPHTTLSHMQACWCVHTCMDEGSMKVKRPWQPHSHTHTEDTTVLPICNQAAVHNQLGYRRTRHTQE